MIKKIATNNLKVGMYIHDLDASWMNHPFLTSRFAVTNQRMIGEVINAGIKHVYIDTVRGLDFEMAKPLEEVRQEVAEDARQLAEQQPGLKKRVSLEVELFRARSIIHEVDRSVRSLMRDIRLGRRIESTLVDEVVEKVIGSVLRNKDALIILSRIKSADQYTFKHSISVCVLMVAFARALEFDIETIHQIAVGALLHDIGKVRVAPEILNKPGPLDQDEFAEMKRHVEYAGNLLADLGWVSDVSMQVVMEHHERIDGTGYPNGLSGDALSDVGRMAAIVDVYDALTSDRPYNQAWEPTRALGKILEWSRDHFGETMAHQFVRCVGIYPVGTLVRLSTAELAVVVEQDDARLLQPTVRLLFSEKSGRHIPPRNLELSRSSIEILESASAQKLGLDPLVFL